MLPLCHCSTNYIWFSYLELISFAVCGLCKLMGHEWLKDYTIYENLSYGHSVILLSMQEDRYAKYLSIYDHHNVHTTLRDI